MTHLDDLTADELKALGHSLRMVPSNTLASRSSWRRTGSRACGEKVARAIIEREDMKPYRTKDAP